MSIKENLEYLLKIVQDEPESQLDLKAYVSPCGTFHCTADLAAMKPFFIKQGLSLADATALCNGRQAAFGSNRLFGRSASYLFVWRHSSPWDHELLNDLELRGVATTDKNLAIARIERALKELA